MAEISRRTLLISAGVAGTAAVGAVAYTVLHHDDEPTATKKDGSIGPSDNVPVPPGYKPLKAKDVDTSDFSDIIIDRSKLQKGQYAPAPYPLPKDRSNWDATDYWNHGYDVNQGEGEESDELNGTASDSGEG